MDYYVCAFITTASAFTGLGFSLVAVRESTEASTSVNALYASARSAALAGISLVPLVYHSATWLIAISVLMIAVQALDAVIGVYIRNALKTYGPALTSSCNALALAWLVSNR